MSVDVERRGRRVGEDSPTSTRVLRGFDAKEGPRVLAWFRCKGGTSTEGGGANAGSEEEPMQVLVKYSGFTR